MLVMQQAVVDENEVKETRKRNYVVVCFGGDK